MLSNPCCISALKQITLLQSRITLEERNGRHIKALSFQNTGSVFYRCIKRTRYCVPRWTNPEIKTQFWQVIIKSHLGAWTSLDRQFRILMFYWWLFQNRLRLHSSTAGICCWLKMSKLCDPVSETNTPEYCCYRSLNINTFHWSGPLIQHYIFRKRNGVCLV